MANMISRRNVLIGGGAIVGTAVIGTAVGVGYLSTIDTQGLGGENLDGGAVKLTSWIEIRPDGKIIFAVPRNEMGQGVYTSLPMLIAEELEVDLNDPNIEVIHPTELNPVYTNWFFSGGLPENKKGVGWAGAKLFAAIAPFIGTGGSSSVKDAFFTHRRAGACARQMLIQAAAEKHDVPEAELTAKSAHVLHEKSGGKWSYASLANDAAKQKPDEDIALKPQKDWTLIGTDQARLDIPAKTDGRAEFGIDAGPEDCLYASIAHCPVFGGKIASVNSNDARNQKGVVKIVEMEDAVAVVATNSYYAKLGAQQLEVTWDNAGNDVLNSEVIEKKLLDAIVSDRETVWLDSGDSAAVLSEEGGEVFDYHVPYLAHTCMEPMNATALVTDDQVQMWVPGQSPLVMKLAIDRAVKNHKPKVKLPKDPLINTTLSGGGFGRRAETDFAYYATRIALAMPGKAVKLVFTREEDIQHDPYRPAGTARVKARLGEDGMPEAMDVKVALQSVSASFATRNHLPLGSDPAKDEMNVEGINNTSYAIPNLRVASTEIDLPIPVGNWRSVGNSQNSFYMESAIDELAILAGKDPMGYRMDLLKDHPRFQKLAKTLKSKSNWASAQASGRHLGLALQESFGSYVGEVVELTVNDAKEIKIHRVTCVVDCGTVVNPNTVKAQMESGIIYALSALAFGEVEIDEGRVVNSNFHDYDAVRLAQCPQIDTYIMENDEAPGGVGEPSTPPLFAAVTNAIFAATGERVRRLPITNDGFTLI